MPSSPSPKGLQVYVAGFSRRTSYDDLKDIFRKFGKIRDLVMKGRYAFVEFDDDRDAEDAIKDMDGYELDGRKLVVEEAGKKPSRRSKGPQAEDKCYKCGKTGHWANECKEKSSRDRERSDKKCYNCGEGGHIKKYCPKLKDSRSRSSSRSSPSRSPKRRDRRDRRRRSPSSGSDSESRSRSRSRDKSETRNKHKKDHKRKSHKKSKKSHKRRDSSSRSRSSSPEDKGEKSPKENGTKNGKRSPSSPRSKSK